MITTLLVVLAAPICPTMILSMRAEATLETTDSSVSNGFARASGDKTQLMEAQAAISLDSTILMLFSVKTRYRMGTGYSRHPGSGRIDLVVGRVSSFRDGKGAPPPSKS